MQFDLKKEWWIIAVVVVVLLGAGYWWYAGGGEEVTTIGEGQELTRPKQEGVVVSGFPTEFLVEPGVVASNSYSIRYLDAGAIQPVVEYTSTKSYEENVQMFWDVLTAYNWNVLTFADRNQLPTTSYYATKEFEGVNVRFTRTDAGVKVSISYLRK